MIVLFKILILISLVLALLEAELRMPTFCVDPKVLQIFSKRLACFKSSSNQTVLSQSESIKDWITYHSDDVRLSAGSPMFTRFHELYAYYWFVLAYNPYRVESCKSADLEFIPFLPVHYVAVRSQPTSTCSYRSLIDDILNFMDIEKSRQPHEKAKERFLIASTFNMRTEMQRGLPSQQRRGAVYEKVTEFVMGTYIGHYERFRSVLTSLERVGKG